MLEVQEAALDHGQYQYCLDFVPFLVAAGVAEAARLSQVAAGLPDHNCPLDPELTAATPVGIAEAAVGVAAAAVVAAGNHLSAAAAAVLAAAALAS